MRHLGVEAGLVAQQPVDREEPARAALRRSRGRCPSMNACMSESRMPRSSMQVDIGDADAAAADRSGLVGGVRSASAARKAATSLSSARSSTSRNRFSLRAEHAHDVRLADARRLGDLVGGGAEVAAFAEDAARGREDQLAPLGHAGIARLGLRFCLLTLDMLSVDY